MIDFMSLKQKTKDCKVELESKIIYKKNKSCSTDFCLSSWFMMFFFICFVFENETVGKKYTS